MFIKKLLIFFFFLTPFLSYSQVYEVGITAGISTYTGDLDRGPTFFSAGKIRPMGGLFARYNFNDYATLRFGGNFGIIAADDNDAKSEMQQLRNLHFKSNIIEGHLIAEFNILGFQPYALNKPFSPYVFAGIAFFNFNPKAEYNDEWIELQPLGTEGQGLAAFPESSNYRRTQISFPLGLGVKYAINDTWNIGVDLGVRKTLTDYLDDVSTIYVDETLLLQNSELSAALANRSGVPKEAGDLRGNANNNDWYMFLGVTLSYNFLDNGLVGSRKRGRRNKTGCSTF